MKKKHSCASISGANLILDNFFVDLSARQWTTFQSETCICIKNAEANFTPTMNNHNFFVRWVRLVGENKTVVFFTKFFTFSHNCLQLCTIVYSLYWRSSDVIARKTHSETYNYIRHSVCAEPVLSLFFAIYFLSKLENDSCFQKQKSSCYWNKRNFSVKKIVQLYKRDLWFYWNVFQGLLFCTWSEIIKFFPVVFPTTFSCFLVIFLCRLTSITRKEKNYKILNQLTPAVPQRSFHKVDFIFDSHVIQWQQFWHF